MHQPSRVPATSPADQDAPGPAIGSARPSAAARAADSPEMTLRLAEDHDRIAEGLNDLVVRRLFSAGLALEAALTLIGEHRAAGKIEHVIAELDRAIADLRGTVFDAPGMNPPDAARPG
jgi:signal transduction histidine kinase